MSSHLFTTEEASKYLSVARQTLAVWRLNGCGPDFKKLGRKVVYEIGALDKFVNSRTHRSTAEYK
ncbi:MAG: helix-turn-helix domain-containing protein [Alphaproteobacteria bacterium]|nr:helix-turn-helix domain-containing protein [Alphaproteobacteria bacterium]